MNWLIDEEQGVVVVKMASNKFNIMNDTFFTDLNNAFDLIESQHGNKPVVLTSVGSVFSAGIDLNHCIPIFESGDTKAIQSWYDTFRNSILRIFEIEVPIIGAINGHAIAGGLILALCCDMRFAVNADAKFGLNEITVGFPMPSAFAEVVKHSIGSRRAEEMIFRGILYGPDEALKLGVFHDVTVKDRLMDIAIGHASEFKDDNIYAYSIAKKAMRGDAFHKIQKASESLDRDIAVSLASEKTVGRLRQVLESLKRN